MDKGELDFDRITPIQWRHNGRDGVLNHQPHHCLLKRLLRCRSKWTSKLRVTGLCAGNSPVNSPDKCAVTRKSVSLWWRQHAISRWPTEYLLCVFCALPWWRHQMETSHHLNQCRNIVNWTLRNKLVRNLCPNQNFFIDKFVSESVVCQSGGHPGLNVLIQYFPYNVHTVCVLCFVVLSQAPCLNGAP